VDTQSHQSHSRSDPRGEIPDPDTIHVATSATIDRDRRTRFPTCCAPCCAVRGAAVPTRTTPSSLGGPLVISGVPVARRALSRGNHSRLGARPRLPLRSACPRAGLGSFARYTGMRAARVNDRPTDRPTDRFAIGTIFQLGVPRTLASTVHGETFTTHRTRERTATYVQ